MAHSRMVSPTLQMSELMLYSCPSNRSGWGQSKPTLMYSAVPTKVDLFSIVFMMLPLTPKSAILTFRETIKYVALRVQENVGWLDVSMNDVAFAVQVVQSGEHLEGNVAQNWFEQR